MQKKSFADILAEQQLAQKRKLAAKIPSWAGTDGLQFPTQLCLEQCSSEATAIYKAGIISGAATIADLTGGLGVDSWAFSRVAQHVFYNEMDPVLEAAAAANFKLLGATGIECSCEEASQRLRSLPAVDLIYMDPARRSDTGKKLFLLEECSPNVLGMLPELKAKAPMLMLKLSPMADISMVASRLGQAVREIHVTGSAGEVKELLCILDFRTECRDFTLIATDLRNEMRARWSEISDTHASYTDPEPGKILFEPSPVLMKAGLSAMLGLPRLAPSTHLYIADRPQPFGKSWMILEVHPFGKAAIRDLGKRYPQCEITARNLPISSDELRKKMGSTSGGQAHIFGATAVGGRCLMVCTTA